MNYFEADRTARIPSWKTNFFGKMVEPDRQNVQCFFNKMQKQPSATLNYTAKDIWHRYTRSVSSWYSVEFQPPRCEQLCSACREKTPLSLDCGINAASRGPLPRASMKPERNWRSLMKTNDSRTTRVSWWPRCPAPKLSNVMWPKTPKSSNSFRS